MIVVRFVGYEIDLSQESIDDQLCFSKCIFYSLLLLVIFELPNHGCSGRRKWFSEIFGCSLTCPTLATYSLVIQDI